MQACKPSAQERISLNQPAPVSARDPVSTDKVESTKDISFCLYRCMHMHTRAHTFPHIHQTERQTDAHMHTHTQTDMGLGGGLLLFYISAGLLY